MDVAVGYRCPIPPKPFSDKEWLDATRVFEEPGTGRAEACLANWLQLRIMFSCKLISSNPINFSTKDKTHPLRSKNYK